MVIGMVKYIMAIDIHIIAYLNNYAVCEVAN